MKICILGAGAFAIALCKVLEQDENDITMWTKFEEEKELLLKTRENEKLFPGVKIDESVKITTNLNDAVKGKDVIINVLPFVALEDTVNDLSKIYNPNQIILSTTKGLDANTFKTSTEYITDVIKNARVVAISGPSFAIDIVNKENVSFMLASNDKEALETVEKLFERDYLTLEETDDIKGIQIAGVIKNAIAIGAGMLDSLKASESTKAAFIAKGMTDMTKIIVSLGGKKETCYSYAGIGDLILTCMSDTSRNYTFGTLLGKGLTKETAIEKMNGKTVEGYNMVKALYTYTKNNNIKTDVIEILYKIIFEDNDINLIKKV